MTTENPKVLNLNDITNIEESKIEDLFLQILNDNLHLLLIYEEIESNKVNQSETVQQLTEVQQLEIQLEEAKQKRLRYYFG